MARTKQEALADLGRLGQSGAIARHLHAIPVIVSHTWGRNLSWQVLQSTINIWIHYTNPH